MTAFFYVDFSMELAVAICTEQKQVKLVRQNIQQAPMHACQITRLFDERRNAFGEQQIMRLNRRVLSRRGPGFLNLKAVPCKGRGVATRTTTLLII